MWDLIFLEAYTGDLQPYSQQHRNIDYLIHHFPGEEGGC